MPFLPYRIFPEDLCCTGGDIEGLEITLTLSPVALTSSPTLAATKDAEETEEEEEEEEVEHAIFSDILMCRAAQTCPRALRLISTESFG